MENNMTQKQALMELLKRIKKYWLRSPEHPFVGR